MQDKYTKFYINGRSSDNYNAYIVYEDTLQFYPSLAFTNEFAYPQFSNTNILLGVQKENRTFELSVLLKEVKLESFNRFLNWINIEDVFQFRFGFQKEGFFTVKTNSISAAEYYVVKTETPGCKEGVNEDLYNISLNFELINVGDWAFQYEPKNIIMNDEGVYKITNDGSLDMYFIITGGSDDTTISAQTTPEEEAKTIFKKEKSSNGFYYNSFLGISTEGSERRQISNLGENGSSSVFLLKPGKEVIFNISGGSNISIQYVKREFL